MELFLIGVTLVFVSKWLELQTGDAYNYADHRVFTQRYPVEFTQEEALVAPVLWDYLTNARVRFNWHHWNPDDGERPVRKYDVWQYWKFEQDVQSAQLVNKQEIVRFFVRQHASMFDRIDAFKKMSADEKAGERRLCANNEAVHTVGMEFCRAMGYLIQYFRLHLPEAYEDFRSNPRGEYYAMLLEREMV